MLYETLRETLDAAQATLENVELDDVYWRELFQNGLKYGESQSEHIKILSIKGKKTRKYFHVVVTRFETGKYELVCYTS